MIAQAAKARAQKREKNSVITKFRADFPADSKSEAKSYTEERYIEPMRSFCDYAEKNPNAPLPTAATMQRLIAFYGENEEAFLDEHRHLPHVESVQNQRQPSQPESGAEKSIISNTHIPPQPESEAEKSTISNTHIPPQPESEAEKSTISNTHIPPQPESEAEKSTISNPHLPEESEVEEGASEVHAVAEPQTPARQPDAQQSRSWFTGVTSILASPLKLLGRRNQSAEAATTNGAAVTGASSIEHLIPQTSDFAIPPSNTANKRTAPHRSTTHGETPNRRIPITPSNKNHRRRGTPRTEPRPHVAAEQTKIVPQTAHRNNYKNPSDTPSHERGQLNWQRRKQLWAKEDEEKRVRDMERKRGEERTKRLARVEEEDEHDADLNGGSACTGEKRKAPHHTIPRPEDVSADLRDAPARHGLTWEEFNWEGTFTVPDDSDSEDDSELLSEMTGGDGNESRSGVNIQGGLENCNSSFARQLTSGPGYDLAVTDRIFGRPNAGSVDSSNGRFACQPNSGPGYDLAVTDRIFGRPKAVDATAVDSGGSVDNYNGDFTRQSSSGPGYDLAVTDRIFGRPNAVDAAAVESGGSVARYTGTLFAQPAHIQANIDENKHPQTPRPGMGRLSTAWKTANLMAQSDAYQKVRRAEKEARAALLAEVTAPISSSGTFSAPTYGVDDSEIGTEGGNKQGKELEAHDTPEGAAEEISVLQPKPWQQTPPPKSKPSNAQLPQGPTASGAEIAKSFAKVNKYQPTRPSGLRNVTQMSPLHSETSAAVATPSFPLDMAGYNFDPEVLAAVMAIPDADMIETQLPRELYEQAEVGADVANEVLRHLG